MGAELITVSTDTEFVHLAWKRDEGELANVTYAMGADPTGKLSRLFGVYDEGSGLALRGTFIISPDGTLAWVDIIDGSGVPEIDRAAKEQVRRGAPFPRPPEGRSRKLNFVYQIR